MNETAIQAAYHAHPVWAFVVCYCASLVPMTLWLVLAEQRRKAREAKDVPAAVLTEDQRLQLRAQIVEAERRTAEARRRY